MRVKPIVSEDKRYSDQGNNKGKEWGVVKGTHSLNEQATMRGPEVYVFPYHEIMLIFNANVFLDIECYNRLYLEIFN